MAIDKLFFFVVVPRYEVANKLLSSWHLAMSLHLILNLIIKKKKKSWMSIDTWESF